MIGPRVTTTRPRDVGTVRKVRDLIEGENRVFLTGIVYQEILQGVRSDRQRRDLVRRLRPFPMLDPSRETHEAAARLRDRCLSRGVTVSTVDALIAQVVIENRCALLTTDQDFAAIARHTPLRIL